MELCSVLNTSTFLKAWRRFVSTGGVHQHLVFSDNIGASHGAHDLITEWIQEWDRDLIEKKMTDNGTKFDFNWEFNAPTASHTKTSLTFEDWATDHFTQMILWK